MYHSTETLSHKERLEEIKNHTFYTALKGKDGAKIPIDLASEARIYRVHKSLYERQNKQQQKYPKYM